MMISRLGRYEVLGELGQGAMGTVYRARDPLIDRVVAIKTINLGLALDEKEEYEGRFYQEAKAAGGLNHPNIVTIFDVGKSDDVAYIAMEFLEGRELRDILDEEPILPLEQVLDIVAQVAEGLHYAHEHDIVHRDIKPANIMIVHDGHAIITDFGIARIAFSAVRTQTGMVLGSPKYMSPEQVRGKVLDQRSDVFSLGVMLYEMLTGQTPFNGDSVNEITNHTLHTVPSPPRSLNAALPEMLNFIVAKALAKDPDDRYQNALDFAIDLRACRDIVLTSTQRLKTMKAAATGERSLPDALVLTGVMKAGEEEAGLMPLTGLSVAFDSSAAVMRLAVLTGSDEDIDKLAEALNISRASAEEMVRTSAEKARHASESSPKVAHDSGSQSKAQSGIGYLLLVVLVLLVLILIALIVL